MNEIKLKIIALLQLVILKLQTINKIAPFMNTQTENSKKVYEAAKHCLGKKIAEDGELGCAEAVNFVFKLALGFPINDSPSTIDMFESLKDISKYIEVDSPLIGDVIIAVTGSGNGKLAHGHVGIIANYGILSNNSDTGLFQEKWDLASWQDYYGRKGGFKNHYYRVL